ncbi:MAG: hypothetical protein WC756_21915 [Taibaiella sp.]|jgi:hypothetical protein
MKNLVENNIKYSKILKGIAILLRPYESAMTVAVRQRDTYCLYTGNLQDTRSVLFVAVQIMVEGVVLTHYQSSKETLHYAKLPKRLLEFKNGNNRFIFTKLSLASKNDLKLLFSSLFDKYKLERANGDLHSKVSHIDIITQN